MADKYVSRHTGEEIDGSIDKVLNLDIELNTAGAIPDSKTVGDFLRQICIHSYPITDSSTTLGDINTILNGPDGINPKGEHVFFDTYLLGAKTYLCTILIDTDAGIYKVMDCVGHRVTEGAYDANKLLTVVLANLDNIATQSQIDALQQEIDELGGKSLITNYEVLGQKILDGSSTDAIDPGDTININWLATVNARTSQSHTVSYAADVEQKFANAIGEAEARDYLFVFDGANWTYNEQVVTLSDYGLSVSGTIVTGEILTVTTTVTTKNFTFTAYDKATAHDNDVPHNWTLEETYAPDTMAYDTYESAFTLAAGKTLAAGPYKLTNYSHRSSANLTIYFTVAADITNSGSSVIQFASSGYAAAGSYYIPASLTAYQKGSATALSAAMSCSMTEIAEAVDVSTVDGVALPGSFDFAVFGNNNWEFSNVRQNLNDDTKDDNYVPTTDFDRPSSYNRGKGFLYAMDPRAKALIIDVDNKYTAGYGNAGKTQGTTYICKDKVFLLSMKEMSFNINAEEGVATDLYSIYTNNTLTNDAVAARAKYNKAGGTLNSYRRSRSAVVYNAGLAWHVNSSGSVDGNYAIDGLYVARAFCFGKHSS